MVLMSLEMFLYIDGDITVFKKEFIKQLTYNLNSKI